MSAWTVEPLDADLMRRGRLLDILADGAADLAEIRAITGIRSDRIVKSLRELEAAELLTFGWVQGMCIARLTSAGRTVVSGRTLIAA